MKRKLFSIFCILFLAVFVSQAGARDVVKLVLMPGVQLFPILNMEAQGLDEAAVAAGFGGGAPSLCCDHEPGPGDRTLLERPQTLGVTGFRSEGRPGLRVEVRARDHVPGLIARIVEHRLVDDAVVVTRTGGHHQRRDEHRRRGAVKRWDHGDSA